jgi:hypothetical protein
MINIDEISVGLFQWCLIVLEALCRHKKIFNPFDVPFTNIVLREDENVARDGERELIGYCRMRPRDDEQSGRRKST